MPGGIRLRDEASSGRQTACAQPGAPGKPLDDGNLCRVEDSTIHARQTWKLEVAGARSALRGYARVRLLHQPLPAAKASPIGISPMLSFEHSRNAFQKRTLPFCFSVLRSNTQEPYCASLSGGSTCERLHCYYYFEALALTQFYELSRLLSI